MVNFLHTPRRVRSVKYPGGSGLGGNELLSVLLLLMLLLRGLAVLMVLLLGAGSTEKMRHKKINKIYDNKKL